MEKCEGVYWLPKLLWIDTLLRKLSLLPDKHREHESSGVHKPHVSPFVKNKTHQVLAEKPIHLKQNISEEKNLSEKEDFMNMLMHDLRTPLARSRGLLEILEATGLSEEQQRITQMISKVIGEGLQLTEEGLYLNSIIYQNPEIQAIDLRAFVHGHIEKYFAESARKKNIYIKVAIEDHLQININALALQRILDNLISNALKFSDHNTTVHVKVLNTESFFYLSVQDEGPGISAEDQKKMFKKFQKLSSRPTAGESSTGLGLAIVKSLVERLGGTINVKSELGKGTMLAIRFNKEMMVTRARKLQTG
jgi:signal transduction histidine kinase